MMSRVRGWLRPARPPAATSMRALLRRPLDPLATLLWQESSAGQLLVDREGQILRANEALRRMVGPLADLSPGQPVETLFAADERESAWTMLAPRLRGAPAQGPEPPVKVRLAVPGLKPLTVVISTAVLRQPDGSSVGGLLKLLDISEQTRLEEQLAHSQRLQAAGQLAGGIAHDFNNLLTAVLGAAEAIAGREDLDMALRGDIADIRAAALRGATLVRQLLAFGRQQTLQPKVMVMEDAIADLATLLRRVLGSRIRLDLALERPGRQVRVDPTAFDQVLINLAINARDAMPDGGVLTLRSGHITLYRPLPHGPETIPPGRYAMAEMEDTGVGIPPDVLPRIFEPFFTTRRDRGGTGLGLATVLGIVRQSGGFLAVESEPGKGTRVRIYLPRWEGEPVAIPRPPLPGDSLPAAVAEAMPPELPAPASAPRRPVLLVDDEETVRRVTERALRRRGWRVLAADSAESALALLDQERPPALSAVVTDLIMPGDDGTSLVRAVRGRFGTPDLPAVLISGYATEELRAEVAAALGDATTVFLPKPYEPQDLAERLAALAAGQAIEPAG